MNRHAVIRQAVAVVAAALVVGGAAACNGDTGTANTGSSSPPVVTVTQTAPLTTGPSETPPGTAAPTESAAPTEPETGPAVTHSPTDGPPQPRPVADYYGYWQGHGRQMTLNPDGTAAVVLADGAANVEKWTATWGAAGSGVEVTLETLTKRYGPPLGYAAGQSWAASIQPSDEDGAVVLHVPSLGDLCSSRFGRSVTCGA